MRKPNILFLFSDQHNSGIMSCAGHPTVRTPNLDQLAEEGIRFEHAYTNNPICTPSRVSFLSGTYPSTHGFYGLYGPQPSMPLTSMFAYFKEYGYRTGALGKLHTPRYWIEKDCQFIYDEFIEYPKYLEGAGLYDLNDNRSFTGHRDGSASMIPLQHSCEMALAKQTIRFLRNEGEPKDRGNKDAPWFAWVSFSRPHQPYTPSEPFASMYHPNALELPPISENEKESVKAQRKSIDENELRHILSAYFGLVSQVDHAIGVIIDELQRLGELDNTIILYTSDHGDYAGEHGLYEKKGGISYRAITRIPLIVRLPDHQCSVNVSEALVESVDVFPTLCELSGLSIPNSVQGISFAEIINGAVSTIRKNTYTENIWRKALATQDWRYIANYGDEVDELYNLKDDPWELHNLIDDPEYIDVSNKMLRDLFERTVQAKKPITSFNGGWHDHKLDRDGRLNFNEVGDLNEYW